jgi:hypothetical protein
VAEGFGDDLDVDSGREHQCGGYVSKVMKADRRQARCLCKAFEEVADFAGVEDPPPP